MKAYNVTIEFQGQIISDFAVNADNLKEALKLAQINKADSCQGMPLNRCKVNVRIKKQ